jgi:hypothetical protein
VNLGPPTVMVLSRRIPYLLQSCGPRLLKGPWRRCLACRHRPLSKEEAPRPSLTTQPVQEDHHLDRDRVISQTDQADNPGQAVDQVLVATWRTLFLVSAPRSPPPTTLCPQSKAHPCATGEASRLFRRRRRKPHHQNQLGRPCMECRHPVPSPSRERGLRARESPLAKLQLPSLHQRRWRRGHRPNVRRSMACGGSLRRRHWGRHLLRTHQESRR